MPTLSTAITSSWTNLTTAATMASGSSYSLSNPADATILLWENATAPANTVNVGMVLSGKSNVFYAQKDTALWTRTASGGTIGTIVVSNA